MTDKVTSEWSDLNVNSSINMTTADAGTASPVGRLSLANAVIVRVVIIFIMMLFNLGGNGFTLMTIRLTPRLWTKTNFILASMLVANIVFVVAVLYYIPFMLIIYVFNNPCHYNVLVTASTPLFKIANYVSTYHLILVSIERYVAIAHPLKYETKFSDRTLKWAIAATWAAGIITGMTFMLWLIDADLRKCDLIPVHYLLVGDLFLVYLPVCVSMVFFYGKILAIWWKQRKRIYVVNIDPAPGAPVQEMAATASHSMENRNMGNDQDPQPMDRTGSRITGPPTMPAMTSGASSAELAEQQRQKMKSRRREFRAVYLTAAIVGVFVILWLPFMLGRILASAGYNPVIVGYIGMATGTIGTANYAFSWVIYAAVSKSYRRAYRQVMIRIGCCCCKNITLQNDTSLVV